MSDTLIRRFPRDPHWRCCPAREPILEHLLQERRIGLRLSARDHSASLTGASTKGSWASDAQAQVAMRPRPVGVPLRQTGRFPRRRRRSLAPPAMLRQRNRLRSMCSLFVDRERPRRPLRSSGCDAIMLSLTGDSAVPGQESSVPGALNAPPNILLSRPHCWGLSILEGAGGCASWRGVSHARSGAHCMTVGDGGASWESGSVPAGSRPRVCRAPRRGARGRGRGVVGAPAREAAWGLLIAAVCGGGSVVAVGVRRVCKRRCGRSPGGG